MFNARDGLEGLWDPGPGLLLAPCSALPSTLLLTSLHSTTYLVRCPLAPAGPHLQSFGVHGLANMRSQSHRLNTARCNRLELLQPAAQGCAQTGAGLLPVRAVLHGSSTEGLHRVGTEETDGRSIIGKDERHKGMVGPPSLWGQEVCWTESHHTAKALGQLHPAFLSSLSLLLAPTPAPAPSPILFPQMTSPLCRDSKGLSYKLLCTYAQSVPGPHPLVHCP